MELLFLYVFDDKKNIKGCSYNFSPNYKFTYDEQTKTFSMTQYNELPACWFGRNIINLTTIVGRNGSGKTNLMECIIKALCWQGGGWIIYKYKGKLYSNVPKMLIEIKFNFDVRQFSRWGSPLNSEFEESVDDTAVTYYSTSIDRALSNPKSHFSKFEDISNAYLLRHPISKIVDTPNYVHLSEVDIMQMNDVFKLLLLFIYSHKNNRNLLATLDLPDYLEFTLHIYSDIEPNNVTYKALTANLSGNFKDKLKSFILRQIFQTRKVPNTWVAETSFEQVMALLNNNEEYRPNIYNELLKLYDSKDIQYANKQQGLNKGHKDLSFRIRISAITQEMLNALYCYYNFLARAPYASYSTMESHIHNAHITINYGVSSGERTLYTLLSRLLGFIYGKQGEIHQAAFNKIIQSNHFDGKTIIILLDEPDLQLHPEWQQKFIGILISSLERFFKKINFQIILTTHSPILLSDVPKSNVLFIEKQSDGSSKVCDHFKIKETFAANIHTLYNNSFFLDGVPIGVFA